MTCKDIRQPTKIYKFELLCLSSSLQHDTHTRLTVSMETGKNDEQRAAGNIKDISLMQFKEFDEELQEPEQKSVADLSSKKVQKKNKELSKQYTQLAKSVDALKKEREELLSDKHKLKSENKTLERDLRRASSKGEPRLSKKSSQMSVEIELDTVEDMALKIQSLEARLAERDGKLKKVRDRLQRLSSELPGIGPPSLSPTSSRRESEIISPMEISQQNGVILDSCSVEIILDERNEISSYKAENAELRAKVASLENNVVQLQSVIGSKEGGENKTRKRSGSIFKRGKAYSKSMVMKQLVDVVSEKEAIKDTRRSKSPDFLSASVSYQDMSDTSVLACTDPKAVGSLPSFVYSGLSPRSAAKRAHGDVQTLQSYLKTAIEEKKSLSEKNEQLEAEVVMVKAKIKDQNKLSEEREQSLQKLECMRDRLVREKKELSQKVSTLQSTSEQLKSDNLSLKKQHASSITKKDVEITNLKNEIKKLKEKLEESETMRKESEDVFVPPTPQSTPKREVKVAKTVVTKPPVGPTSQTKPSVKDGEGEKTRKTSQPRVRRRSSSSSLEEHFDSVSNTRALFEQKIVTFKDDKQSPKRSLRKTSLTDERRGSYSSSSSALKPNVSHAKSSSFDASNIVLHENSNQKRTSPPASVRNKTVAESPSASSKPKTLNISKSDTSSTTTSVKSFTSTNKEISPVTKVSKIIVKSTASPTSSPVFGRQISTDKSVNASSVFQRQTSVPVTVSTVHTTTTTSSTSKKTNGVVSRNLSVDSKKDAIASSAKRTVVSPVRTNSVIVTTTSGTNGLSSASKVTVTTTNTNTNTDFIRRNPKNQPRPQSVLLVPTFSIHKANSLQNIPEKTASEVTIEPSLPRSTPTDSTVQAPQQSPVARRYQRRERNERPKTMYAGRAETTNLVNLISRFQKQETEVKKSDNASKSPPATVTVKTPQVSVLSPATPTTKTTPSTPPATGVVLRNSSSRSPRPKTYYGAPNEK